MVNQIFDSLEIIGLKIYYNHLYNWKSYSWIANPNKRVVDMNPPYLTLFI